jgi:hypothetical protein
MKKKIPTFKSDAAAGRFVSRTDLTRYDLSGLKPVRFEFERKSAQLLINWSWVRSLHGPPFKPA